MSLSFSLTFGLSLPCRICPQVDLNTRLSSKAFSSVGGSGNRNVRKPQGRCTESPIELLLRSRRGLRDCAFLLEEVKTHLIRISTPAAAASPCRMRSKHTWNSKTHADTRGIIKMCGARLSARDVLGQNSLE